MAHSVINLNYPNLDMEPSAPCPSESEAYTMPDDDESASLYTSDVIKFLVHGKVFSAHRKLLQAKSPVFAAMFKHKTKESRERSVEITDIDAKVFEKLLMYIYKDKVNGLETYAVPLWIAADKYQIDALKLLCEQHMCPELSHKTVIDGLLFADTNRITKLRSTCIDYLNVNSSSIIKNQSTKWSHFTANANVPLFTDLYTDLSTKHFLSLQTIATQNTLIDNLRANRPEDYSPTLNRTRESCRIFAWFLLSLACLAFIAFLGYVVYIGIGESVTYAVLFGLLASFVVLRFGVDFYRKMLIWWKNRH